mmetsp:Transcript_3217/g.7935  ORF Transcript_3217/g.7935 Transcript_3217/m.7935 type:complete len:242 (-) Transcript_3217:252-977(-)
MWSDHFLAFHHGKCLRSDFSADWPSSGTGMTIIWCMHVIHAPNTLGAIRLWGMSRYVALQYVFTMSFTNAASCWSFRRLSMAIRDWSMDSRRGKAASMTGASTSRSSLSLNSYLRHSSMTTCTAPYTRGTSSVSRYRTIVGSTSGQLSGKSAFTSTLRHSTSCERIRSGDWMSASRTLARTVALSSSCRRADSSLRGSHPLATRFLKWIAAACRMGSSACGATATCIRPTTCPLLYAIWER